METIKNHFFEAKQILDCFISDPQNFINIEKAGEILVDAIKSGKKVISCGNGGSMSDAIHFAEELSGRYRNDRPAYPAIAISDPGHLSCVANDYGYDFVFSRMIEAIGFEGDVLLAISVEIRAPRSEYADRAQEIHIKVIHSLIDYVESRIKSGMT